MSVHAAIAIALAAAALVVLVVRFRRREERELELDRRRTAEDRLQALELVAAGVAVQWIRPQTVDREASKRGELTGTPDLVAVVRHRLEVKFRDFAFTGPGDYPYPTAFVGRRGRWDRSPDRPLAIVLVSRETGGIAVVPGTSRPQWAAVTAYDRITGRDEESYACPRELLVELDALVEWIRARDAGGTA